LESGGTPHHDVIDNALYYYPPKPARRQKNPAFEKRMAKKICGRELGERLQC
jgi:hypothetical protein